MEDFSKWPTAKILQDIRDKRAELKKAGDTRKEIHKLKSILISRGITNE